MTAKRKLSEMAMRQFRLTGSRAAAPRPKAAETATDEAARLGRANAMVRPEVAKAERAVFEARAWHQAAQRWLEEIEHRFGIVERETQQAQARLGPSEEPSFYWDGAPPAEEDHQRAVADVARFRDERAKAEQHFEALRAEGSTWYPAEEARKVGATHIARRYFTLAGTEYEAGEIIDVTALDFDKREQLVAARFIAEV